MKLSLINEQQQEREMRKAGYVTYALDLCRSPFAGVLESGMHTVVLLIVIRLFDPAPFLKALIPSMIAFGLICSPFVLSFTSRFSFSASRWASLMWLVCGLLLLLCSFSGNFPTFMLMLTPAMFAYALVPTFMIFVYATYYNRNQRGQRLAVFYVVSSLASAGFSLFAGPFLDIDLANSNWLLRMLAIAAVASALCAWWMPSPLVEPRHHESLRANVSLCWTDKLFGGMLVSWMFIGLANLMTLPLRVEYLASPRYGLALSNAEITLLLILIPSICRIVSTRIWGLLFDRMNLLILRSILNALFLVSIFFFFTSSDFNTLALSMAVMGTAQGGGNIAWSLWVTKLAPPEKTAAYMSLHTATTGLRGIIAPFLGFAAITWLGPTLTATIASMFALLSIVLNWPMVGDPRLRGRSP